MILTKKNAPAASSNISTAASTATNTSGVSGASPPRSTGVALAAGCTSAAGEDNSVAPTAAPVSVVISPATAAEAATQKRSQRMKSSKAKRKKFNKGDDLLLLRQVNADHPYMATRGGLMGAWTAVPRKLHGLEDFSKTELTGKSAQARFNVLIDRHRDYDKASAAASGVSEDHDEVIQLLDDLLLELDEHARVEELKSVEQKEKLAAEEKTGKYIRDEAVSRLKKRKEHADASQTESPQPRKVTVFDIMREDNAKEREMRAEQWNQEQEMMRQQKEAELSDRKEEREFRLRIARLENERFKTLLELAKIKSSSDTNSADSVGDDMNGDC